MHLFGAVLDTITEVLEGWSDWNKQHDTRWKALLLEGERNHTYVNGMPILQAYFRALFADRTLLHARQKKPSPTFQDDDDGTDNALPTFGGYVVDFFEKYCHEGSGLISEVDQEALLTRIQASKDSYPSSVGRFFLAGNEPTLGCWMQWLQNAHKHKKVFFSALICGSHGRSFFTTSNDYIGTGPPYTKKGDKDCIIQGANVPFLLRPDKEGYRLVGEAFVLGLMDGEYEGGFEEIEVH
jgi:hypothetical protein